MASPTLSRKSASSASKAISETVTKAAYPRTPHTKKSNSTNRNSTSSKRNRSNSSSENLEALFGPNLNDKSFTMEKDTSEDDLTYISESDDAKLNLYGSKKQKKISKKTTSQNKMALTLTTDNKVVGELLRSSNSDLVAGEGTSELDDFIKVQPIKDGASFLNEQTNESIAAADTSMNSTTLKDTSVVAPLPLIHLHLKQMDSEDYQSLCKYPRYVISQDDLISMLKQSQKVLNEDSIESSKISPPEKKSKLHRYHHEPLLDMSNRRGLILIYVSKDESEFYPLYLRQFTVYELKQKLLHSGVLSVPCDNALNDEALSSTKNGQTNNESSASLLLSYDRIDQLYLIGPCGIRVKVTDELLCQDFEWRDMFTCQIVDTAQDHVCNVVLKRKPYDY